MLWHLRFCIMCPQYCVMYSVTWYCKTVLYVTCCVYIYTVENWHFFRGILFFKTCINTTERKRIKRKAIESKMTFDSPKCIKKGHVCKGTVGIRNSKQAHRVTCFHAKGERKKRKRKHFWILQSKGLLVRFSFSSTEVQRALFWY